ncbi:hypothetical protein ASA1KI_07590 [Opitutales bacterium ASA1]|nr:hypothetical protein ASA1KI_07590 [Opitutales bacterium ASA1]
MCACLAGASVQSPEAETEPLRDGLYALWHTPRGTITAELFPEQAPLTVAAFVGLAEGTIAFAADGRTRGRPFFDGLTFHRVVEGFVVQGGDPLGTGEGGPGFTFVDEFSRVRSHDAVGVLAMANAGPNTNGSQFYFTLSPVPRLDYKHTVFGKVIHGVDVLPRIERGDAMQRVEIARIGAEAALYRIDEPTFAALREAHPGLAQRDPTLSPLFQDTVGLDLPEWLPGWLNEKLHNYHAVTGTTIFVRTWCETHPENPARALRDLHHELAGDDPNTALLVFVADGQRWHLHLGKSLRTLLGVHDEKSLWALSQDVLKDAVELAVGGDVRRSVDTAVTALIGAIDRSENARGATPTAAPR